MKVRHAAIVAVTSSLILLTAPSADAAELTGNLQKAAEAKPTPPVVVANPDKDSVIMEGSTVVRGRLTGNEPSSGRNTQSTGGSDGAENDRDQRSLTRPRRRAQIRLNIGICGRIQPDGTAPGPDWCQPFEPTKRTPGMPPSTGVVVERRPQPRDVTWERIRTEVEVSLFAKLPVFVQPKARTLVNVDTIVYTHAAKVYVNELEILDFPVIVEATPMKYTWRFGDGTQTTTASPGAPYPSKEITHKYMKRAQVGLTVTTYYAACFSVANLARQCLDELIPTTGPVTPLRVREAVPVLVEPSG